MRTLLMAMIVVLLLYTALVLVLVLAGRTVQAKELVSLIPNLLRLFRDLVADPGVPRGPKIWLGLGIVWLLSPIDLLPEFLPVLGPLDDAIVAALVLRHLVRRAGPEIVRAHWSGDPSTLRTILRAAGIREPSEGPSG